MEMFHLLALRSSKTPHVIVVTGCTLSYAVHAMIDRFIREKKICVLGWYRLRKRRNDAIYLNTAQTESRDMVRDIRIIGMKTPILLRDEEMVSHLSKYLVLRAWGRGNIIERSGDQKLIAQVHTPFARLSAVSASRITRRLLQYEVLSIISTFSFASARSVTGFSNISDRASTAISKSFWLSSNMIVRLLRAR